MPSQRQQVIVWSKGYVTSGLIARFLGSNNTGNGHSTTTAVWKDLVRNNDLTLPQGLKAGTRQWGINYFESLKVAVDPFAWLSGNLPPEFTPEKCTAEIVFMPYTGNDAGNGGDVIGFDDISTSPYTTITLQMNALNANSYFQETGSFTLTYGRAILANNIYSTSMSAYPYNSVPARNGQKRVFYNGILAFTAPRTNNFFVQLPNHYMSLSGNPVIISNLQNFYGRIYEVRVYNRVLSPAEVLHNANLDRAIYGIVT